MEKNLPIVTWGHFFLPAWSINVLVLIDIPIPHVAEHGDHSDHLVVLQTPRPSPASSTFAWLCARFSSGSSIWFLVHIFMLNKRIDFVREWKRILNLLALWYISNAHFLIDQLSITLRFTCQIRILVLTASHANSFTTCYWAWCPLCEVGGLTLSWNLIWIELFLWIFYVR